MNFDGSWRETHWLTTPMYYDRTENSCKSELNPKQRKKRKKLNKIARKSRKINRRKHA